MFRRRLPVAILISTSLFWIGALEAHALTSPEAEPVANAPRDRSDLLTVLSERDIDLYTDIFSLQARGAWSRADKKISALENDILMGYVLHQRYLHPTAYKSKYSELRKWMAFYADHPEARRIYRLALKKRPRRASAPVRPTPRQWRNPGKVERHPALEADYKRTSGPRLRQIEGRVRYLARKEQATTALKEIRSHLRRRTITQRQFDRMQSWIAASLYYQGYVDTARRLANEAAERSGESAVLAHWIAGLIDFREGRTRAAHTHFAAMAANPYQDDDLRSAAGFWAARTALAAGRPDAVTPNLEIAANYPFTFYGQLSLSQLGRAYAYDWTAPVVTENGYKTLSSAHKGVTRAAALVQVGRMQEADLELRWVNGSIDDNQDYDLMAIATGLNLPSAQLDIALAGDGDYLHAGRFPIPDFAPRSGFKTDRALLYALMRQESKFKPDATSRVGARGLMQLMPRTASHVARDRNLRLRSGRNRLYEPGLNLDIGQKYVNQLIDVYADGNLFHMAVAYNGGPGNLRRWRRAANVDDPLLFIESIPNPESRDFVEKVLTNVWVYRARLGQPAPSRDKVAAGALPLYEAIDQIAGAEQ